MNVQRVIIPDGTIAELEVTGGTYTVGYEKFDALTGNKINDVVSEVSQEVAKSNVTNFEKIFRQRAELCKGKHIPFRVFMADFATMMPISSYSADSRFKMFYWMLELDTIVTDYESLCNFDDSECYQTVQELSQIAHRGYISQDHIDDFRKKTFINSYVYKEYPIYSKSGYKLEFPLIDPTTSSICITDEAQLKRFLGLGSSNPPVPNERYTDLKALLMMMNVKLTDQQLNTIDLLNAGRTINIHNVDRTHMSRFRKQQATVRPEHRLTTGDIGSDMYRFMQNELPNFVKAAAKQMVADELGIYLKQCGWGDTDIDHAVLHALSLYEEKVEGIPVEQQQTVEKTKEEHSGVTSVHHDNDITGDILKQFQSAKDNQDGTVSISIDESNNGEIDCICGSTDDHHSTECYVHNFVTIVDDPYGPSPVEGKLQGALSEEQGATGGNPKYSVGDIAYYDNTRDKVVGIINYVRYYPSISEYCYMFKDNGLVMEEQFLTVAKFKEGQTVQSKIGKRKIIQVRWKKEFQEFGYQLHGMKFWFRESNLAALEEDGSTDGNTKIAVDPAGEDPSTASVATIKLNEDGSVGEILQ